VAFNILKEDGGALLKEDGENLLLDITQVEVPDVVGDSQATGTSTLEGDGFVVSVATAHSSTVPVGDIISQSPIGGVETDEGSTVTIWVSVGPSEGSGNICLWRRRGRR
jgi:beta-lactam-binding protein with PASTA domain